MRTPAVLDDPVTPVTKMEVRKSSYPTGMPPITKACFFRRPALAGRTGAEFETGAPGPSPRGVVGLGIADLQAARLKSPGARSGGNRHRPFHQAKAAPSPGKPVQDRGNYRHGSRRFFQFGREAATGDQEQGAASHAESRRPNGDAAGGRDDPSLPHPNEAIPHRHTWDDSKSGRQRFQKASV